MKLPPLGLIVGLALWAKQTHSTATMLHSQYPDKYSGGEEYLAAITSLRKAQEGTEEGYYVIPDLSSWASMAIRQNAGLAVGIALHEGIGNARGAFGSGFGLKLNRYLSKFPIKI